MGIKVKAPATISNLNCGFDVLGMALDITCDEIIAQHHDTPGVHLTLTGTYARQTPHDAGRNTAGVAVQNLLGFLGMENKGIALEIRKKIKPGSGLGSSAASACAAVVAANELLGRPLDKEALLPFAILGEYTADQAFHADNVAPCLLGGCILVRDLMQLDVQRVYTPPGLFVTAVLPDLQILTSDARGVLDPVVPMEKVIRQNANIGALIIGMQKGDFELIGNALHDHIIEDQRKHLIRGFDQVKNAALKNGALGCGISGAGPTLFAITDNQNTADACGEAMVKAFVELQVDAQCYTSEVHMEGTRVC